MMPTKLNLPTASCCSLEGSGVSVPGGVKGDTGPGAAERGELVADAAERGPDPPVAAIAPEDGGSCNIRLLRPGIACATAVATCPC